MLLTLLLRIEDEEKHMCFAFVPCQRSCWIALLILLSDSARLSKTKGRS
jgi:hypothetical protein